MKSRLLPYVLLIAGLALVSFHFIRNGGTGSIDVKIFPAAYIMPSAYKVYGNSEALNGRYNLFRAVLTNTGSQPVKNVKVSYEVPGYITWTDIKEIPAILPGQRIIVTCYPKFKPDIADKKTSSSEKGNIRITSNGSEKKESFSFDFKGVNDFIWSAIPADEQASYTDVFDNMVLLPCLITPNDPVVKYYTAAIQQKILQGETAGVTNDPKEMVRFLEGIYEATRRARMVYSSTGGVPEKVGDINSLLQNIRLPREVIIGNTGLCIELSLLYASILSNAGLNPVIYLIPGHAYPGFIFNNQLYAIEATGIGGQGLGSIMTAEEALKTGTEELKTFLNAANAGDERYKIIYVNGLIQKGAVAMELKDDPSMRQRIDNLFANADAGNNGNGNMNAGGNAGPQVEGTGGSGNGGTATYTGVVSFNYPATWLRMNTPVPGFPALVTSCFSPTDEAFVHVYNFVGKNNLSSALSSLQQFAAAYNQQINFQIAAPKNGYQIVYGSTLANGITHQWTGFFRQSENGISGVIAGATASVYNQWLPTLNSIIYTLR